MRYSLLVCFVLSLGLLFTTKTANAYEAIRQWEGLWNFSFGDEALTEPIGFVQTFKGVDAYIKSVELFGVEQTSTQDVSAFVICEGTFDAAGNFYDKYVNDPYPTYGRQVKCADGEDFVPVRDLADTEGVGVLDVVNPDYATSTYQMTAGQDYYMIFLQDRTTTGQWQIGYHNNAEEGNDVYANGNLYRVADDAATSVPVSMNGDALFIIHTYDEAAYSWEISNPPDGTQYTFEDIFDTGRYINVSGRCENPGTNKVKIGVRGNNYCQTTPQGVYYYDDCSDDGFFSTNWVYVGLGTTTITLLDADDDLTGCYAAPQKLYEDTADVFVSTTCPAGTQEDENGICLFLTDSGGWCTEYATTSGAWWDISNAVGQVQNGFKSALCWAIIGDVENKIENGKDEIYQAYETNVPLAYWERLLDTYYDTATSSDRTINLTLSTSTASGTNPFVDIELFDFDNQGWNEIPTINGAILFFENTIMPVGFAAWVILKIIALTKAIS